MFSNRISARKIHIVPVLVVILLLLGLASSTATAQTLTIRDWTGRGFPSDLVNYTIDAPGGRNLSVIDDAGRSLPVQITPGENGKATLSFVASLQRDTTSTYTIRTDGRQPAAPPAVSSSRDGNTLILASRLLAVRVPAPVERVFDPPAAANTLPAPILAFRGADGAWRGAGTIVHQRPVSRMTITMEAAGPVFVETRYRIEYANGGHYEARVRVTERLPFARVSEEFELGVESNTHFWQIDLSNGWQPDAAEHMSVAGQGHSPVVYPSLAEEERTSTGNIDPSLEAGTQQGDLGRPNRSIHHDSCWGSHFVSYYGVHRADARQAQPDRYPLAMVAPLHKGAWRRANSLPVYVRAGRVIVRFPMDSAPASWLAEPRSDYSPFSCHEHDPAYPEGRGRRVWALVLAHPEFLVRGYNDAGTEGVGYAVRNLYGTVGLDRYKDYILEWQDTGVQYPRVFITPEGVEKYREAVKADPAFPLLDMLRSHYWFTGNPATAQRELPQVHQQLQGNINYKITALSIHHHQTLGQYGTPIARTESVLSWPDLPENDRRAIRARLALLAYLLVEPDVTSAGNGSHHGNPNMGVSRLMDRSNVIALIPDHPMHGTWSDYAAGFMAYKAGSFMAPEGAWFEYGASYHMHGYGKVLRGLMGVLSSNTAQADRMWNYHRQDFDYFMNLLSPVDPRYGSRTIPGTANSPVGQSPHYLQAMGTFDERDPEFAAHLRWAWNENGGMVGTGADSLTIPAMVRPWIQPQQPQLTSRHYPGFGVIFRAHQGPDETVLYLRSGYLWSHWNQDQGNLMLYAKGAVLLPCQPYQYGGPKDRSFTDKNLIRFGHPNNEFVHNWADSNVIDAHFGSSVDYAWASAGYPDWYITPGAKQGWVSGDRVRKLAEGIQQQQGTFTWDRQVAFLKGATGKSPNYFVIRDSMNGEGRLASWFNLTLLGRAENVSVDGSKVSVDTEWPAKLDMLFLNRAELPFETCEHEFPVPSSYAKPVASANWVDNRLERQVTLRLQSAPGEEIVWVLYPRGQGETAPDARQLAPGVYRVVTAESTDYVFLSTTPLKFSGEGVEFEGLAGALRLAGDGSITFALFAGPGKVGYAGRTISSEVPFEKTIAAGENIEEAVAGPEWAVASPDVLPGAGQIIDGVSKAIANGATHYVVEAAAAVSASDGNVQLHARRATVEIREGSVRFVVPERAYVQLSVGNIGLRGVGPFDLTLTSDDITGTVDGGVRTIVATWPENIVRPMYRMDGVRWYAGFADEHSIVKGTATPQFGIAIGVSAGPHQVKISEWEWPAMPTAPRRSAIAIE